VAHIEMDQASSYSLKTRSAYYYLKENGKLKEYHTYLMGDITRNELYSLIPDEILDSTINLAIGPQQTQKAILKNIIQLRYI
jgi:DNA (cytosine-5)-methyltransferase 1